MLLDGGKKAREALETNAMSEEYTHTPQEVAEGILSGKYMLTSVFVLVNQIEDVTREREEARREVERLREKLIEISQYETSAPAGFEWDIVIEEIVEIAREALKTKPAWL